MKDIQPVKEDSSNSKYKCWFSSKGCKRCDLIVNNRMLPTLGLGFDANSTSEIMFVGEAPGRKEMLQRIPFIGDSGQLLRKYIKDARLDDVSYMTNIIKCRPPANRKPVIDEIKACSVHLEKEIKTFKPKVIVCLGTTAKDSFGFTGYSIKRDKPIVIGNLETVFFILARHPAYIIKRQRHGHYDILFKILKEIYHLINPHFLIDF